MAKINDTPATFVIFGATGDLSRKKIFPSFFELFKNNLLPQEIKIVGAARSNHTKESFLALFKDTINTTDKKWHEFAQKIEYFRCDIEKNVDLDTLKEHLDTHEKNSKICVQRIYYLAISPYIYNDAFENLGKSRLNIGCQEHGKSSRIVIEKPFGYDYKSAQLLNATLEKFFTPEQIYRIDHVLGKETVQNIFAFRFANEIFEPIWNNKYVDHVQITYAERGGIEMRGEYYDRAGALRDIVQNHLLQLLTITTMEEPSKFDQMSIRQRKLEILKNVRRMTEEETLKSTVRGQYEGYLSEEKVSQNSQTETYALVKLFIDSPRWQGVPFYLRTGKMLEGKVTSVIFTFKENPHQLFKDFPTAPTQNHITLQIQPNEGIGIHLAAKKPGLATMIEPVDMEFCYKTSFNEVQPDAYERLILDIILGDQTLFIGQVGESWKIIDPIRNAWDNNKPKLATYKQGSWGPKDADELIKKDKRQWLAPLLSICKI